MTGIVQVNEFVLDGRKKDKKIKLAEVITQKQQYSIT